MRRGSEGSVRCLATIRPDPAFSPGPGYVLAPHWYSPGTGVACEPWLGSGRQR